MWPRARAANAERDGEPLLSPMYTATQFKHASFATCMRLPGMTKAQVILFDFVNHLKNLARAFDL